MRVLVRRFDARPNYESLKRFWCKVILRATKSLFDVRPNYAHFGRHIWMSSLESHMLGG